MRIWVVLLALLIAWPRIGLADVILAARTISAREIVTVADIVVAEGDIHGAASDPALVEGLEAKVTLYVGRPIMTAHLGTPALVDRNQIVTLVFENGGLVISTDARALGRGGVSDAIRVMNLSSRTTVTGIIQSDGTVIVTR